MTRILINLLLKNKFISSREENNHKFSVIKQRRNKSETRLDFAGSSENIPGHKPSSADFRLAAADKCPRQLSAQLGEERLSSGKVQQWGSSSRDLLGHR